MPLFPPQGDSAAPERCSPRAARGTGLHRDVGVSQQHLVALATAGKALASLAGEHGCLRTGFPLCGEDGQRLRPSTGERGTRAAVCAHRARWPAAPTRIPATGRAFRAAGAAMQGELVVFCFFSFFLSPFFLLLAAFGCLYEQLIWVMTFAEQIGEPGAH